MADEIVKRGPGQPRKYMPDTLEQKFMDYLQYCHEEDRFANIDGFAIFAKMDEQTFYNYKHMPEYFDCIKNIERLLLDETIQKAVKAKNPAYLIFYSKNKFGWADKQEIVQSTDNNVRLDGITADDLKSLVDVLKDE